MSEPLVKFKKRGNVRKTFRQKPKEEVCSIYHS